MGLIAYLLSMAISIFIWIVIIQVVISWLIVFDVINVRNDKAQNLIRLLNKVTDPIFKPLRKYIPAIGGIDITPIIVIFGAMLIQSQIIPRIAMAGYF